MPRMHPYGLVVPNDFSLYSDFEFFFFPRIRVWFNISPRPGGGGGPNSQLPLLAVAGCRKERPIPQLAVRAGRNARAPPPKKLAGLPTPRIQGRTT